MNIMEFDEFKDKLFAAAQKAGFSDYEIYYATGESFRVNVYEKEIDNYSVNSTKGLGFRGLFNGSMGYAYTEILDDNAIELLVNNAKANAAIVENVDSNDIDIIFGGSEKYPEIKCFNDELSNVDENEKIKFALEMERMAFDRDKRVKSVEYCAVQSFEGSISIVNSKGLELHHRGNGIYSILIPVVSDGERKDTAVAFISTRDFNKMKVESIVNEAVENALAYMGAGTVNTGKYRVILRNDAAADLLETFSVVFSADRVQKGMSLLKDKTGKAIASETVTIIDDPLLEGGMASAPFDGEGVACYTKNVVKGGRLVTLLHNLKTARKDGVSSTGNASRPSYASTIDVSPSNFYIKPGESSLNELYIKMGDGLLITELQGLHSGANSISGDFSLAAKGFEILNSKITRPVEQITVAGNFYKLLENIEETGSDLKFGIPSSGGCFGSPSILIKELSVGG
ncbi:MAG TPA: TldD/PmbA family protein [Clostridiales bacterium]|nr:TldD/PmbA family protein [Clostridiales bacterium]